LAVIQNDDGPDIKRTMISEYSENTVIDEQLTPDGKEKALKAPFGNAPGMGTTHLSEKGDTLFIDSKVTFNNGGRTNVWTINEAWTLKDNGKVLSVKQSSASLRVNG
jgi:hypothetical protein